MDNELTQYIYNYLEATYSISVADNTYNGDLFRVHEINNPFGNKNNTRVSWLKVCSKILGECFNDVYINWFETKSDLLLKELKNYLDNSNISDGGLIIMTNFVNYFSKNGGRYFFEEKFLTSYFNDYYERKIIRPILDEIKNNFDGTKSNSQELIDSIGTRLALETDRTREYADKYLNDWYADTFIGKKLTQLFSEFIVTLAHTNWRVTRFGHGQVTKEKLLQDFIKESEFQKNLILLKYEKWYEKEVLETSERLILRNVG